MKQIGKTCISRETKRSKVRQKEGTWSSKLARLAVGATKKV